MKYIGLLLLVIAGYFGAKIDAKNMWYGIIAILLTFVGCAIWFLAV